MKKGSKVGEEILFYTCMIVLLTLLVNGMTTGLVIKALGLQSENMIVKSVMARRLQDHDSLVKDIYHKFLDERNEHGDKHAA